MRIKNDRNKILKYAKSYDELFRDTTDETVEKELVNWFSKHKYLDRGTFLKLCLWKSSRPRKHYEDDINSDKRVRMITSLAINSEDEYFKIKALQLLKGISWPVASVILHFSHPNKYMIMDFRAIWSLGWQQPKQYTYEFWTRYTKEVTELANRLNVNLRTLDKALWFYSKEYQDNPR